MGIIGDVASLGGLAYSLFGGGSDTSDLEDAINRQNALQERALQFQEHQANLTRQDLGPYRSGGENAYITYLDQLGLSRPDWRSLISDTYDPLMMAELEEYFKTGVLPAQGSKTQAQMNEMQKIYNLINAPKTDPTALLESYPGHEYTIKESENALDRYLSGKGMSLSGAGLKTAEANRQGLASTIYDNLLNRIQGVATMGKDTAVQGATLGTQSANAMANTALTSGQQGVNSQYLLEQQRNSSYNSPWGWIGNLAGRADNYLNQYLNRGGGGNAFSNFNFPEPEMIYS